jgi:radical SAM superfamily enzyme YgiQ (UPF0313 family)
VDEFQIVDDIFNLHKPRLKEIFSEVKKRYGGKIFFSFPNGVRGDILDEEVLDAMRDGGTYAVCIAIETVTPRLQTLVEKNLKIDRALWAIDEADKRGMMVSGFFMLGFPTETEEELKATVSAALKSRLTLAHFFSVIPQPETPLYPLAMREGRAALEAAVAEEEDGAQLRQANSWYEMAYDYPLGKVIRNAHLRFYFSPTRMLRIARRVPLKSLMASFVQFMRVVFVMKPDVTATRPE